MRYRVSTVKQCKVLETCSNVAPNIKPSRSTSHPDNLYQGIFSFESLSIDQQSFVLRIEQITLPSTHLGKAASLVLVGCSVTQAPVLGMQTEVTNLVAFHRPAHLPLLHHDFHRKFCRSFLGSRRSRGSTRSHGP